MLIKIVDTRIDLNEALEYVRDDSCGAVTVFEGNIRNENEGEAVVELEYEVYDALFRKMVGVLIEEAQQRWRVVRVAVVQRIGLLQVGDTGIVIAVSSGHRRDALDALSYLIEEFKKRVPVWKKERTQNSEKWINWVPQEGSK